MLNPNGTKVALPATISPADFPVGSAESRAAARAVVARKYSMTQDEEDYLTFYYLCPLVNGHMVGCDAVHRGDLYGKCREVFLRRGGIELPAHEDPHLQRMTAASLEFELARGREPKPGDVLLFENVAMARTAEEEMATLSKFEAAWHRQLPNIPFPLKMENGRMYHLEQRPTEPTASWVENDEWTPERNWERVESVALGIACYPPARNYQLRIGGVIFEDSVGRKHKCRALTPQELDEVWANLESLNPEAAKLRRTKHLGLLPKNGVAEGLVNQ